MPIMLPSWMLAYLALPYYLWGNADCTNANYATIMDACIFGIALLPLGKRRLHQCLLCNHHGCLHIWHCPITFGETQIAPMPIMQPSWMLAHLALSFYLWGNAD